MHCCCSVAQPCPTLWDPMDCSTPGLTISQSLPKFMFIPLVMPSNHLIHWHSLPLPSVFLSIRYFPNVHIRWPKYWSFRFSISEYSGLVFKTDWFDLLAVQGTFRTLLQHHSSKASILWHSAFFAAHLSRPSMTTGKTIALSILDLLSAEWCLCFSTHCLGLSQLSCQEAKVLLFHGCSHHPQWFSF